MISPSVPWCHRVMMLFFWESALGKTTVFALKGKILKAAIPASIFSPAFHDTSRGTARKLFSSVKNAVVIGGGNTAIDCVRTLVRLGVADVTLVYRRTRNEMPANRVEIEAAEHEGINFVFLAAPVRIVANAKGHIMQLEYLKMELGEPDASGRRRPVPIKGSETLMDIDMLITAIGQGPDTAFAAKEGQRIGELALTRWNTIDHDPEIMQANIPYVFTGGDSATGASLVVEAIGGGRRAARAIHMYLNDEKIGPVTGPFVKSTFLNPYSSRLPGLLKRHGRPCPELPVEERIKSFVEADLVITEADASYEASRCLNCCRICYNKDSAAKDPQAA